MGTRVSRHPIKSVYMLVQNFAIPVGRVGRSGGSKWRGEERNLGFGCVILTVNRLDQPLDFRQVINPRVRPNDYISSK